MINPSKSLMNIYTDKSGNSETGAFQGPFYFLTVDFHGNTLVFVCLFFSRRSLEMLPDVAYKTTTMDVYFTQIIMASKTEQKQPMKVGESNQK